MKTEQKLVISGVILLALLGGYYAVRSGKDKDAQAHAASATKDLPKIAVDKDKGAKVTKVVVKSKDHDEVVLEKKDGKWRLTKPIAAAASASGVESILTNLEKIELGTVISQNADAKTFEKYELDDKNATHVQVFAGGDKAFDVYFGKSGTRGQTARLDGDANVYAAKGYSSYLYGKETKNWRDTDVVKFEDANVVAVEIENKKGKLSFTKNGDKWGGAYYARDEKKGGLAEKASKWERFDEAKVKDMLTSFKNLKATDFAKDKDDTGIDKAVDEGGVVRVKFKDGNGDFTVKIGKKQEGTNRFLQKEGGEGTIYVISSWTADWATADMEKFSKPEEKKDDKKGKDKDKKGGPEPIPDLPEPPGGDLE